MPIVLYLYIDMSKISRQIAVFAIVFLAFALAACFQPVDLEEMREYARNPNGGNGENGEEPGSLIKLGYNNQTLDNGQEVPLSINGNGYPSSLIIKVLNTNDFTGDFSWSMNEIERTGVDFEVKTGTGTPFSIPGNYILTVIAFRTNGGAPHSAYLTISVVE